MPESPTSPAPLGERGHRWQRFVARYARWLEAHHRGVLVAALVLTACTTWLSGQLEVRADFANLLSPTRRSVQDLERIKSRVRAFGSLFVVVEASDPTTRERAAQALYERLNAIDPGLIANLAYDDKEAREFLWERRFLLVDLDDLKEARDAIEEKIRRAKLAANPLFISLEDDDEDEGEGEELERRIASLERRLDEGEAAAKAPPGFVSRDRHYQLIAIRGTFTASEVSQGRRLLEAVNAVTSEVVEGFGADIRVGITGDIVTGVHEHRSILRGMVLAALVTVLIVALALLLYYRSILSVMSLLWALAVGSVATFGVTELLIGHLNLATAFLAAIVVGNGINAGLILMARYFEELRLGHVGAAALGNALIGAAHGTLAASLTAGVAYASLIVTDFRGFRHFGIIGCIGMVLCWLAAFTVLPAALMYLRGRITPRPEPAIGRFLARLMPGRLGLMATIGLALTILSGVLAWRYIASDPLEEDWRNLRSTGPASVESRSWDQLIKREFDQGFNRNLSGRFVVATRRAEDVPPLVERLREAQRRDDLFLYVRSFDDLIPPDQVQKRAVLDELRELIDDELSAELEGDDKELLARVRPPDDLEPLAPEDVPEVLTWLFTELDGTRGRIIHAASGMQFDTWNVRDLVAFSERVRALDLPDDVLVGGQAFIFADMLSSMEEDIPQATLFALLGSIAAVWLVIGLRRHGLVTLACALAGTLGMIALVSLWDIKVNFLDFIALPITIGIGIDYAVNIAVRERQDGHRGPGYVLATTGGAVFLCSFTTTVGYGSLLLSENAGIRSFGLAAILGEISCMIAALLLAPAILALMRRRWPRGGAAVSTR